MRAGAVLVRESESEGVMNRVKEYLGRRYSPQAMRSYQAGLEAGEKLAEEREIVAYKAGALAVVVAEATVLFWMVVIWGAMQLF